MCFAVMKSLNKSAFWVVFLRSWQLFIPLSWSHPDQWCGLMQFFQVQTFSIRVLTWETFEWGRLFEVMGPGRPALCYRTRFRLTDDVEIIGSTNIIINISVFSKISNQKPSYKHLVSYRGLTQLTDIIITFHRYYQF